MSQTSIPRSGQPRAIAGMIADNGNVNLISAFNGESSAPIDFGLGVVNPGTERVAKLPAASGDKFMGVSAWDLAHQPGTGGFDLVQPGGIQPKGGFEVVREGRVWVQLDAGVSSLTPYSDRPYLRYETDGGSNTVVGRFGKASDGHNIDLTKLGVFVSGVVTAADGTTKIALLELEAAVKP